ncbi:MAG: hypothetical protein KIS80_07495, partial [Anaerolineales bacterium]|nr:hypothetical protein [Anaerolineales bacterium]
GGYGGSILLAHAFAERPQMRRLYTARYGFRLLKQNVKCLAWKESERINRVIREKSVDLGKLVKKNKTLRFLHPIRNPLDCSVSIVRTGMMPKFYPQLKENDLPSLVELILGEIRDFLDLAQRHPDHFFFYFQDDLKESVLNELAKFLGLSDDQRWVKDSMKMYQLRRPYKHEPTLKEHYRRKVDLLFKDYPDVKDHLLKMATNHE